MPTASELSQCMLRSARRLARSPKNSSVVQVGPVGKKAAIMTLLTRAFNRSYGASLLSSRAALLSNKQQTRWYVGWLDPNPS